MILLYILILHLFFVWVLLRLIVPHLGFFTSSVPKTLPDKWKNLILAFDQMATDDRHFLELVYGYITKTYPGSRIKTVTQFWKVFLDPLTAEPGFLPCTAQNFLLRTLLIHSGRFTESDISVHVIPFNLFIHQYLRVSVGNEFINVDPWSHFLGIKFGEKPPFLK